MKRRSDSSALKCSRQLCISPLMAEQNKMSEEKRTIQTRRWLRVFVSQHLVLEILIISVLRVTLVCQPRPTKHNCLHTCHSSSDAETIECGPMPNVMAAQPNIGSALCSTPQSLADAHY